MDSVHKILGIDYGRVRIGVAESFGSLAEPLKILPNTPEIFSELLALCQDKHVTEIVVGISENEMADESAQFAKDVERICKRPVFLWDETLSSAETHRLLREREPKKKAFTGAIDHFAAAVILQRYLDEQDWETVG